MRDGTMPPLWPHQEQAVKAVVEALRDGGRCQVIMACGTGKTRVGAEASRELAPDGKVLVVVPTLELLAQTARAYAAALGAGAGVLGAVCSEAGATIEAAEVRGELGHLHAGVSTDAAEVAAWLKAAGRVTVLATYQSLDAAARAALAAGCRWDLVVVDEAHRTAGARGRPWGLVHDDRRLPAARRAYLTATPKVMEAGEHDVVSMDDPAVFGPEAFRLSFADAIGQRLLADYRVAVVAVTDDDVARLASPRATVSAGGLAVPGDMLAAQVALLKACARWGLRRVITYHHRVHRARRFAQTLANAADLLPGDQKPGLVRAAHVDGGMPLWQRRDVLRHLGDPGGHAVVVANARVLTEGVDVPELDAVMFADPRQSGVDVVQAVGRALRKGSRDGKVATLIVPLLIAGGESPQAALEGSAFDMVWGVIRALRSHDERLADWLDAQRLRVAARTGPEHGPEESGLLPAWLDVTGIPAGDSFARAVHVRMVEATTSPWLAGHAAAVAYHAARGNVAAPFSHVTPDGYPLGKWLGTQRALRKRRALSPERARMLDDLGMRWEEFAQRWQEALDAATAYHAAHGDLEVPQAHVAGGGLALGTWISNQRTRQRHGSLSDAQKAELDALGMRWGADWAWQRGIAAAREYHAEHGHLDIPKGHPRVGGTDLAAWVQDRRKDHRDGTIPPRRAAELEALGITWRPFERDWEDGLAALAAHRDPEGIVRIPETAKTARGMSLGVWASNRRAERKAGTMPADRIAALDAAGFVWDPHEQDWRDGLADCRDYHAGHGNLDIRGRKVPGKRLTALDAWLARRRREHAAGTLAPWKAAALEELGMDWDGPRGRQREEAHAALREFHAANGHIRVAAAHVTEGGVALGTWLHQKKGVIRRGGQSHPGTLALLRELGADWLPPGE